MADNMMQGERASAMVLRRAGVGYGVLFGVVYAMFVWGYDAWLLGTHAADVAWGVAFVGTLFALVIGSMAGFAGVLTPWGGVTVGVWAIAVGLLGWTGGWLPYTGAGWVAGLRDARFAGLEILPYLHVHESRTVLLILADVVAGIAVGYVQSAVVERAWDRTTASGRLGLRSWVALALGALVAVLPAAAANALVMQPRRNAQLRLSEFIAVVLDEGVAGAAAHGLNVTEAERHGARFSEDYTVYFTGFYTEGDALYSSYADVVFADGFALRCIVMGSRVSFCTDVTAKLDAWAGDLVHAGLTGEQRWLDNPMQTFTVDEAVVVWLRAHSGQMDGDYTVERLAQTYAWLWAVVRFDSGFEMMCRFHGAAVVNVDQCRAVGH